MWFVLWLQIIILYHHINVFWYDILLSISYRDKVRVTVCCDNLHIDDVTLQKWLLGLPNDDFSTADDTQHRMRLNDHER
jgi:hypothetical protein